METVVILRSTAKKAMNAFVTALHANHNLGPNWNQEVLEAAAELNNALGCMAMADFVAKRTPLEEDQE